MLVEKSSSTSRSNMPLVSTARMNFAWVRKARSSTTVGTEYAPLPKRVQSISRRLPVRRSLSMTISSPATSPPCSSAQEIELLAVGGEHGLHVVHDRVRFLLRGEGGLPPVVGLVVRLSLGGMPPGVDQVLAHRQHLERLGEGLDRADRKRPHLALAAELEKTRVGPVLDVGQGGAAAASAVSCLRLIRW